MKKKRARPAGVATTEKILARHFRGCSPTDVVTTSRSFPLTRRVDVQWALDERIAETGGGLFGVHPPGAAYETLTFSGLFRAPRHFDPVTIGPMQFDDVEVGEKSPVRCVRSALWLGRTRGVPFALLVSSAMRHGQSTGTHIEVAVPAGLPGKRAAEALWDAFETRLKAARSFAGKTLSLETDRYGAVSSIRVHRLHAVTREELVLPAATLELVDRNVLHFCRQREALARVGLPLKKGVLFYGPPGTGKTHTVHYLARELPDHTTLLITAEQVGNLEDYVQLARFLQPALVVLEDVDLIARARNQMRSGCEETLLNKLLNEMDGLREDAAILFVLTTNAPQQLEAALASRPGRIDQAIEFPLPQEDLRKRLARLYACGARVNEETIAHVARRTDRASASFIKELMRRALQFALERGAAGEFAAQDVDAALHEMVVSGGTLNRRLLGLSEP
jgi:hypothetical protein